MPRRGRSIDFTQLPVDLLREVFIHVDFDERWGTLPPWLDSQVLRLSPAPVASAAMDHSSAACAYGSERRAACLR